MQWDATVRWLEKNYPGISKDSSKYGNYGTILNGSVINTGSNDSYVTNNIYDMCGNVKEWTMEANIHIFRCNRGGYYYNNAIDAPVSARFIDIIESDNSDDLGFRFALYIK